MISIATVFLSAIASLLVAVLLTTFFIPTLRTIKMIEKLPGPPQWPVFGVSYELAKLKKDELLEWFQKNVIEGWDRVCVIWLIGVPMVFVNNPQDVEVILSSMKHIEKGIEYFSVKPWLNEGLLVSSGKKWHQRRKLLTPSFHFKILEGKSLKMYENAKKLVKKLLDGKGRPFDPTKIISRCTLDVISEVAMGVSLNSQDDKSSGYVSAIGRVTYAAVYRTQNLYLRRNWLWKLTSIGAENERDTKFLHEFTDKIISKRRAVLNKGRPNGDSSTTDEVSFGMKKRQAFLDKLLELDMEQALSDSDIREEVDTFLFEGHDTTAAAIEFALFELGQNPEIQELAYQEQRAIFGSDQREASLGDLQNMNYLERFIKEVLRLYPSVPYISRAITEDVPLKDFPTIPAGSNVVITPFFLHRNPKYFPEPEKFDPDRFLPEKNANRHPFAYIPFSAGPRNCIGQKFAMMELKVILSTILRHVRIEEASPRSEMHLATLAILRNVGTIKICALPRSEEAL